MSIGALAGKAIRWLVKAFRFYRSRNAEFKVVSAALRSMGIADKVLEKLSKRLIKVEETWGAHTTAWAKIKKAKKSKTSLTLNSREVAYLYAFKRVFDGTVKKRFSR